MGEGRILFEILKLGFKREEWEMIGPSAAALTAAVPAMEGEVEETCGNAEELLSTLSTRPRWVIAGAASASAAVALASEGA